MRKKKILRQMPIAILAVLFSLFLEIGFQLDTEQRFPSIITYLGAIILSIFFYFLLAKVESFFAFYGKRKVHTDDIRRKNKVVRRGFCLILAIWGLYYLAMFPGVYGIDAPTWYYEFSRADIAVSSQWSYIVCAFFYYCIVIGKSLFHSAVIGFSMYSFFQMCFMLYAVWRILKFISATMSTAYLYIVILFFCVLPTHAILAVTSAQDGPFTACFAICLIELYQLAVNKNADLSKKYILRTVIWLSALCIIRNNGKYAIIVGCLSILLWAKGNRRMTLIPLIIAVIISSIYTGPVYSVLHVQKGTAVREMLSIPLQQMARAYNSEELCDKERENLQFYLTDEQWKGYLPCISDSIKNYLDPISVKTDPIKFAKIYLSTSMSAPKAYFEAVLYQTFGLWYPFKQYTDVRIWHPFLNYAQTNAKINWGTDALKVDRKSKLTPLNKFLGILYGYGEDESGYGGSLKAFFTKVPIWGIFNTCGIYFAAALYVFLFIIRQKKHSMMVPFGLVVGETITVFLSPVILYRYYAPVIFSAPVWLSFMLWIEPKRDTRQIVR